MNEKSEDGYEENKKVKISPELKAELEAKAQLVSKLEGKYASRGLKFTRGFAGSVPVQAYGIIDGFRFYFRYRGDHASIRIGFIKEDRMEREYARDMMFHQERLDKARAKAEETGVSYESVIKDMWLTFEPVKTVLDGITDYPSSIRKQAYIQDFYNESFKGTLDAEECEEVFTRLIENLENVDYEDPIIITL